MNQAQLFQDIEALPPHAQQEVIDFIDFIKQRYGKSEICSTRELTETEYLLQSSANASHLEQSIAEYKTGKVVVREMIDE
ncbi:DUF2281 domain-containing protein [Candidatus Albibeggiatoa sp. nov. BB20]|uniref:DUF2281 domain-containing protein n=1 Tax=Candidatus Albibeggiatoa sp. nov. BB20 TaxID=3162723 RepID=UPI0033656060